MKFSFFGNELYLKKYRNNNNKFNFHFVSFFKWQWRQFKKSVSLRIIKKNFKCDFGIHPFSKNVNSNIMIWIWHFFFCKMRPRLRNKFVSKCHIHPFIWRMTSLSSKLFFRSFRKVSSFSTSTNVASNAPTKEMKLQVQSMAPSEPSIIHPIEYSTNAEKFANFIHSNKGKHYFFFVSLWVERNCFDQIMIVFEFWSCGFSKSNLKSIWFSLFYYFRFIHVYFLCVFQHNRKIIDCFWSWIINWCRNSWL